MILWREYSQLRQKVITQLEKQNMFEMYDGRKLDTCSLTELLSHLQHLQTNITCEVQHIVLYPVFNINKDSFHLRNEPALLSI